MRTPEAYRPGTRLIRFVRWLGVDRNPLRRPTDRIEAAIRLTTMILLLVAVPLTCIVVGRLAADYALREAHALAATDHQVTAVLLEKVPGTAGTDPDDPVQTAAAQARWQPPGHSARSGLILAPVGTAAGRTVPIWIDASGAATGPPPGDSAATTAVSVAVVNTCLVAGILLLVSNGLARRALNQRRMRSWDAEWRATGPLWSGRR
jgi:hypothetical protein